MPAATRTTLGLLRDRLPHLTRANLVVSCILLGALALRLYGLSSESLWSDELATVEQSDHPPWSRTFWRRISGDVHPPGYVLLIWLFRLLLGDSEFALRLPSALGGVAGVFFIYKLGYRLYSRVAGLGAALLAAVSPFLVQYSQQARAYSILFALATAALLAWMELLRHEPERRVRRRRVVTAAALSALCAYMHYSGLLFVAAVGTLTILLAAFCARGQLLSSAAAAGIALALYVPWANGLLADLARGGLDFMDAPDAAMLSGFPLAGLPPYVYLGCAVLAAAGHGPRSARAEPEPQHATHQVNHTLFLGACLLVVVLGFYVKSVVGEPIYSDKNLIVAWPPIFVLLGAAATRATSGTALRFSLVVLALLACLMVLEMIYVSGYYSRPPRQDFRRASKLGLEWIADRPKVSIISLGYGKRFDYYLKRFNPPRRTNAASGSDSKVARLVKKQFESGASSVLLLTAHGGAERLLTRMKRRYRIEQHRKLRGEYRGTTVTLLSERPRRTRKGRPANK